MALEKIVEVRGRAVPVMGDDIDTDRIIPARFMKCVTFDGLGEYAFFDARRNEDGTPKEHPLNDARFAGATILLAGANFGCGSSREHAPQALYRFGFRGVVAESFAEIFYGNSVTLGMPCFALPRADLNRLADLVRTEPETEVVLDIDRREVRAGDLVLAARVPDSSRDALMEGHWDPIAELLENIESVEKRVAELPYT